jgi:hypothetical protein
LDKVLLDRSATEEFAARSARSPIAARAIGMKAMMYSRSSSPGSGDAEHVTW